MNPKSNKINGKEVIRSIMYSRYGSGLKCEYKFLEKRRFRFDFAVPEKKIAIEYEGIIATKSRHTSIIGYTNDCNKYNLAAIHGWRVIRLTALNCNKLVEYLEMLGN